MELRQIRYFQALGRELHFARAAESFFHYTASINQADSATREWYGCEVIGKNETLCSTHSGW